MALNNMVKCKFCDGLGANPYLHADPVTMEKLNCNWCNGTGWLTWKQAVDICDNYKINRWWEAGKMSDDLEVCHGCSQVRKIEEPPFVGTMEIEVSGVLQENKDIHEVFARINAGTFCARCKGKFRDIPENAWKNFIKTELGKMKP